MGMTRTTMWCIQQALDSCAKCPGFEGAALATADGLVLASAGNFQGDIPAACATSLAVYTTTALAMVTEDKPSELMVWTPSSLWYLTLISDKYSLLVATSDVCKPGVLRATAGAAARQLAMALAIL